MVFGAYFGILTNVRGLFSGSKHTEKVKVRSFTQTRTPNVTLMRTKAQTSHKHEGFSFSEVEASVNASEMADFTKYLQKYAAIQPRTYCYETPFYRIFRNARQRFCLGNRPEDLEHIATIEKRAWEGHLAHLNRLERFSGRYKNYTRFLNGKEIDTF